MAANTLDQFHASLADIVSAEVRPRAAETDRKRRFPSESMAALGRAGALGLMVPERFGGLGGRLEDLVRACREVAAGCASTGMCFLMHQAGVFLTASLATDQQGKRFLAPAARGDLLFTLAFSERGTGAHFYNPEIRARRAGSSFVLDGEKSFVTSGGQAGIYPVLVQSGGAEGLTILLVPRDSKGLSFQGSWDGVGLSGNSSISMRMAGVQVDPDLMLGKEGDGMQAVLTAVAPSFLLGLAGVNAGLAQEALRSAVEHARQRTYPPEGRSLATVESIQIHLANMSAATESALSLALRAAKAADSGLPEAMGLILQAKVVASEAAIAVTNLGMQVCGGQGYTTRLPMERHWRDARAGAVMAPTNDVLKIWVGKLLAGLPLF